MNKRFYSRVSMDIGSSGFNAESAEFLKQQATVEWQISQRIISVKFELSDKKLNSTRKNEIEKL